MRKILCLLLCMVFIVSLPGCDNQKIWPAVEDMQTLEQVVNLINKKSDEGIDTLADYQKGEQLLNEGKLVYTLDSLTNFYMEYTIELWNRYIQTDIPDKINQFIKRVEEIYPNMNTDTMNEQEEEALLSLYYSYNIFLAFTQNCDDRIIPAMEEIGDFFTKISSKDTSRKECFYYSLLIQTESKILRNQLAEAVSFAEANVDMVKDETKYLILFRACLAKGNGKEAAHQLNMMYHSYPDMLKVTATDIWMFLNTIYSYEMRGIITRDTVNAFLNHFDYRSDITINKLNQAGKDAGLKDGDKIQEVNGVETYSDQQIHALFALNGEDVIKISRPNVSEPIAVKLSKDVHFPYQYDDPTNNTPHICNDAA